MRHLFKAIFLISLLISGATRLNATAQYGDRLIINKDTIWIDSNPLETYFERKGTRTIGGVEMIENCTALWRGYVATWKLENKRLYLVRVQTDYCGDHPNEIDISKEFGTKKVFANWANQIIVRPKGELIQYVHMGYESIYEEEIYYSFKGGILTDTRRISNLVRDKSLVFPGEGYLIDTIRKIILKNVDSVARAGLSEDSSCFISIVFNENRRLSIIGVGYSAKQPNTLMEKTLHEAALKALKGFPRLMKVTHKRYSPPTLQIFFSGHCLKYPHDREYGCNYE